MEAVDRIRRSFGAGIRRTVFVLPTGGGKSYVFCYVTEQARAKGRRVLILVHRERLLQQASDSLTALGVEHGTIRGGRRMDLSHAVQVASIQTVERRLSQFDPGDFDLVVVDEAHHSNAATWGAVIEFFAGAFVLGVTATPCRADGRGLGEFYDDLVLGPSPEWLTENGFLAPARQFAPPLSGFSVDGVKVKAGEFDMKEVERRMLESMGRSERATKFHGDFVEHYRKHLSGRTAIAFCCTVEHGYLVAEAFNRAGIQAEMITGRDGREEQAAMFDRLARGETKVLASCSLIGEGVDVPSVAGVIMLRPTMSYSLYLQMIGRGLRPQPGKTAVVLDHVGNIERHGHHLNVPEWTLAGKQKRKGGGEAPIKVCPECYATVAAGVSVCPECGHEFRAEVSREHVEVEAGDLVEVERVRVERGERKREQALAVTYEQLVALGRSRGYRNPEGWAYNLSKARERRLGRPSCGR